MTAHYSDTVVASDEPQGEHAPNFEDRCPCVLLLDKSSSMAGIPIRMVNDAIAHFKDEMLLDSVTARRAEIAVVAFNHDVSVVQDFVTVHALRPPELSAAGGTKMTSAINHALDMIARRKEELQANHIGYYRPIVILLTDGYPQHDTQAEIDRAVARIEQDESGRHVAFFAFGVKGADMKMLAKLAPKARGARLLRDVQHIGEIFQWLSKSLQQISHSQPGQPLVLPTPPGLTVY